MFHFHTYFREKFHFTPKFSPKFAPRKKSYDEKRLTSEKENK